MGVSGGGGGGLGWKPGWDLPLVQRSRLAGCIRRRSGALQLVGGEGSVLALGEGAEADLVAPPGERVELASQGTQEGRGPPCLVVGAAGFGK